jgi:phosphatidylglycerol---prolipoprotein diacylglyceryl transferase
VYPRLFQLGHLAIPTAAVFTVVAILAGLTTARTAARYLDLDPEKIWDLGAAVVLIALIAPRLILVFANWNDFRTHPLWLIGVMHVRSHAAVAGGIAVALVVVILFARMTHTSLRRTLDAFAPGCALGFTIAGLGNFLAGAAFGTFTKLPWAVEYTRRLASLWYGTPLGSPLHPVQIYAAIFEAIFFGLLVGMIAKRDRLRMAAGRIAGTWLFLHGIASFALSFLRGDLLPGDFLTATIVSSVLLLSGGLLWLI